MEDSKVRGMLELKEGLQQKLERYEAEADLLRRSIEVLDSVLKQSSFTKASEMDRSENPSKESTPARQELSPKRDEGASPRQESVTARQESIPIKHGNDLIAEARITPERIRIILNEGIDPTVPPFKSFFMGRIIAGMSRTDEAQIKDGKLERGKAIKCDILMDGSKMREITISNYRQRERVAEIINTAGWSFSRMLEKSGK